jgi:hypothetical protein
MIRDFGDLLEGIKAMSEELRPNPEPAEGQVPAGDFHPVPEEKPEEEPESEPEPGKATKSVNEVAKEVLAGKFGRGHIRKQRLQDAGYDVAAVSEEIKTILNQ